MALAILRRNFVVETAKPLFACCLLLIGSIQCESRSARPNILLIVADDLGYNDLGLSNPDLTTPSLDRLAREGVRFSRHYTDSTCSPTRAGLLTGLNPARVGFRPLRQGISPDIETLPKLLSSAGYNTFHVGKWHVGNAIPELSPVEAGFDHWYGYLTQSDLGGRRKWPQYIDPWLQTESTPAVETPGHLTDLVTDKTLELVDSLSQESKPWFINLWYFAPHGPLQPAQRFADKYPDTEKGKYQATIEQLDSSIGRIIDRLQQSGLSDQTLVVFMSDNGGTNIQIDNNRPFAGQKGQFLEGGVRTPMIWNWPTRLEAGQLVDETVSYLDLLPTLASVSGTEIEEGEFAGKNIWPAIQGAQAFPKRPLYWESLTPASLSYSVLDREGRFRLIYNNGIKQLFEVAGDSASQRDVIAEYPDVSARLEQDYQAWHGDQHAIRVQLKPLDDRGAAIVVGDGVQRSPGYAGFTFAIGVKPLPLDESSTQLQIIASDAPYWKLGFQPGQPVVLDMLGERLRGPILEEGKCAALIVTTYYNRSRRFPRNESGQIDFWVNGALVDRVTSDRPAMPPKAFDRQTRIGFDRDPKKKSQLELTPPQFYNDYFTPAVESKTKSDAIERLNRQLCSPAVARTG